MNRRADLLLYAYCIYCIAPTKADAKTPTATSAIAGTLSMLGSFMWGIGGSCTLELYGEHSADV